ncbi:MAG: valine--tRNA ligase [Candidatus Roizmanbacteria bacterium]|nr:MAG: valine--tRNA ligase [Candidatus Roizmanbacteria bacterium]
MEPKFIPSQVEEKIYKFWEEKGYFKAKVDKNKKPFSIILPPPNANADLHLGQTMYVYEDIMVRYHKLLGDEVLWLPGADHAGFETQYVFEKHLQKQGKSRFDYDRDTLYKMIWDFVINNKSNMENQLKRLGFALDWSKEKFTLDPDIVKIVYKTFKKLYDDGLVYRSERLVNYCTKCGTGFSDLEVVHVERTDPLYYMKYGSFILATVRPETKFGDTAVAVNPKDKRYKKWVGQEIEVEGLIGKFRVKVIADEAIDPKFGTGVAKVTPAHDMTDFEIGKRHDLEMKQVIGFDGKLTAIAGPYAGLRVKAAREKVVEDMKKKGLIDHIDENYTHTVSTCYKCNTTLEPLPIPQWYVRIRPLADRAIKEIKAKKIYFLPKRFKKMAIQWLTNFHDWNISRQVVWGIRIPAWHCIDCDHGGIQEWVITDGDKPEKCTKCQSTHLEQDIDTFDTWFSSAQWPYATLLSQSGISNFKFQISKENSENDFFNYFYPTSVMETGYDILPWWVARMIMMGYYVIDKPPFRLVFLHGLVRDKKGQKMSKSKGNVINPIDMVDKYGADALRMSLLFGAKEGNDISMSEEKIVGMRNFTNKIWNIGRFIHLNQIPNPNVKFQMSNTILKELKKEFEEEKKAYLKNMKNYQFTKALDLVYDFLWHRFADYYIEQLKDDLRTGKIDVLEVLRSVYKENLIMLHPFAPFVTEAVWKVFEGEEKSILDSRFMIQDSRGFIHES